jgi:hypothetical protein
MLIRWLHVAAALGLLGGCAGLSAPKPVEVLDERTGVTLAVLQKPIELTSIGAVHAALTFGNRASFAYLGPVEWNRMGTIGYGLWVHIAPGTDRQIGDIRAPSAVTLLLDDGPLTLLPIDAPDFGSAAYQPVVSWGETAYFELRVETLKRMAASRKLELDVRAADGVPMSFLSGIDTRATLTDYMHSRGITGD